ncbi:small nuclear ribonucleoprotein Sm D3 [Saitozyma podzolica]|uniref:Small nuclear ribonucleoprotein Sm D3 n=1 Tax=Saitozyma podzolica TaxID=1890683 RepID=A0A427YS51_9TREE|nr:small nuclear ribonucleoprotein Sm D3 [Saitozyma podzolica]
MPRPCPCNLHVTHGIHVISAASLTTKTYNSDRPVSCVRTSHLAPRTSHLAPRTSHLAPRTSHLAPRTSHLAPRTSHLAPRTTAEDSLNIALREITVTARDGRVSQLEQVYIRGSMIRFIIVPDLLANAPMFKRVGPNAMRGRGIGAARGRATIQRAMARRGGTTRTNQGVRR